MLWLRCVRRAFPTKYRRPGRSLRGHRGDAQGAWGLEHAPRCGGVVQTLMLRAGAEWAAQAVGGGNEGRLGRAVRRSYHGRQDERIHTAPKYSLDLASRIFCDICKVYCQGFRVMFYCRPSCAVQWSVAIPSLQCSFSAGMHNDRICFNKLWREPHLCYFPALPSVAVAMVVVSLHVNLHVNLQVVGDYLIISTFDQAREMVRW
jgi:hypothetical protein